MFWATIWEKNDTKRVYINANKQRAKVWVEPVLDSQDFRIRYKLESNTPSKLHYEFALPLALNNNNREPNSLACRSFEVWQESINKNFKTWDEIYNHVKK